jgi:hypothetical protein
MAGDSPDAVRYRFSIVHEKYWPRKGNEVDIDD